MGSRDFWVLSPRPDVAGREPIGDAVANEVRERDGVSEADRVRLAARPGGW